MPGRGWGVFPVEVRVGRPFVGFVGLNEPAYAIPCGPCVEVAWRLARTAWGKGYAIEAAGAAVDLGFRQLGLAEIVAFTAVGNDRSRRVMQRLGMTHDVADDLDHPMIAARSEERRGGQEVVQN